MLCFELMYTSASGFKILRGCDLNRDFCFLIALFGYCRFVVDSITVDLAF